MSAEAKNIGEVLDYLQRADHGDAISVGDILEALEDRSLGVIIAALGLLAALPVIGAIPGVSILICLLILAAIGQSLIGRLGDGGIWLPDALRRREVDDESFDEGVAKVRPWTEWVDRRLKPRLALLTEGQIPRLVMTLAAALLSLSMIPLALVPWGVQAPAVGLVAFGLALMTRDGVMGLIGYALTALSAWLFFVVL